MFEVLWSKTTAAIRGLPRPYAVVPKETKKKLLKGLSIASKVPIPYQSESNFDIGFLGLSDDREQEVLSNGLCPYCGLGFYEDEVCVIWITYPHQTLFTNKTRVLSDHFPFHINCMKETRLFCPHMKITKDKEFKTGLYTTLLKEIKEKVYFT
jgi:hypothetical protein